MRRSVSTGEHAGNFVNKDPFYRTNDILKGAFQKNVRLVAGQTSMTNCEGMIWVNFNPKRFSNVGAEEGQQDGQVVYLLDCGHLFKAGKNKLHDVGKCIPCFQCGGEDAYRSFEHEWSHIIFRSDPHLWQQFITSYLDALEGEGYQGVKHIPGIRDFLHLTINAFDDIRVTSLWERVYAGSADEIWKKWKRLCEEDDQLNENFISWIFGVALDADNLNTQDGPFSDLIPVMMEATDKVRGKGTTNMLTIVRWALDRCVKRLLQNQPPQGDQGGEQQDGGQDAGDPADDKSESSSSGEGSESGQGDGDQEGRGDDNQEGDGSQKADSSGPGDSDQDSGSSGADSGEGQQAGTGDQNASQSNSSGTSSTSPTSALANLADGAKSFQEDQDHRKPGVGERDKSSQANRAAVNKALTANIDDSDDQALAVGITDDDMQQQVTKLLGATRPQNVQHFLLADAKAKILLVPVMPKDIELKEEIEISPENKIAINRMRAAFARVMGRQSSKMSDSGLIVDPQSAIQHRIDPNEVDVFEEEVLKKGFAYLTLCDMSGSMKGKRFTQVCVGSRMLKEALDYPFVHDELWGFRGAIDHHTPHHSRTQQQNQAAVFRGGEIWVYKYDRDCRGYIGKSRGYYQDGRSYDVEVKCGGLTPMNSSIHVAVKHMITQVPAGMAKRIFLLTDGYPTHVKTTGRGMSKNMLIDFVEKEVRYARQHGVQVYTFIMGNDIDDDAALKMFGPRRYWQRVDGDQSIGQALLTIVLREFIKYLRSK